MVVRSVKGAFAGVGRVGRRDPPAHRRFLERVVAVVAISLVFDLLAAVAGFLLERHAKGTEITNFGDAIFWTSTQLLTVSSQVPNPLTTGGRVLDVAMEAYAITVVAGVAGVFANFFHERSRQRGGNSTHPHRATGESPRERPYGGGRNRDHASRPPDRRRRP